MNEDEIFNRAWSFGLDTKAAWFVAEQFDGDNKSFVDHCIKTMLKGVAEHRSKSQMRRYVIRNRRAYHHDQAIITRHEREIRRCRDGMRCHQCRNVPYAPGEIPDPDSWKEAA